MLKQNYNHSLASLSKNSLISLLTAILILAITFNLSWLLILVRISSRLTTIENLSKTIFSLESLLFWGNFSMIMLSIGLVWGTKKLGWFKRNSH